MSQILFVLLLVSAFVILFGHLLMSILDRLFVYPRRLAKVQKQIIQYPPTQLRPSHLPPAIVSQLVFFGDHYKKPGKSYTRFTVTLLDLIHRQTIYVTRKEDELFFSPLGDEKDLLPYELLLKRFIRDAAGDRLYVSLTDLLVYIEANRERAAEMRSLFLKEVTEDFISRCFSDEISFQKNVHPLMYIGEVAVAGTLGVALGWFAGNVPLGLISVGLTTVATSLCLQVFRYKLTYLTDKGVETQSQWRAYGEYLSELTPETCKGLSGSILCDYAVYATALEQEQTFASLASVWEDIAEDHPECILYEPRFFKKLTQIDNSILISNISSENSDSLHKVIKKGHG